MGAYRTETYNADQWAQIAVGTPAPVLVGTGSPFIGVLVRWNSTNGYLLCFFGNQFPYWAIFITTAGSSSTLIAYASADGSSGSPSPSNPTGTTYTGVAKGSRISLRANGVEILAVTDTTCTTGQPGYLLFPTCYADNFSAGNV
jgi:hypothetical protein